MQTFLQALKVLASVILSVLASLCIYFLIKNIYLRGVHAPFLLQGFCLSIFILSLIWVKIRKTLLMLLVATLALSIYTAYQIKHYQLKIKQSWFVFHYADWEISSEDGQIHVSNPLGAIIKTNGPYLTCNFSIEKYQDYFDFAPQLCVAYDLFSRITLHYGQQGKKGERIRNIQINRFALNEKTLLGEIYTRQATRYTFIEHLGIFSLENVDIANEKEFQNNQSRVLETLTYDSSGTLTQITESSLLNLLHRNVYAVYNTEGQITQIPTKNASFSFPSKINTKEIKEFKFQKNLSK